MKMFKFLTPVLIIAFVVVSLFFIIANITREQQPKKEPTKIPLDVNKDYSSLNKTVPGKSSEADVVAINGAPDSIKREKDKTTFYYQTPRKDFKNLVVFKNGVETYAIENIFGDYRGNYQTFIISFGQPDLVLYQETNPFVWNIFLKNGLGIETNQKDITKIVYFVSQKEEEFMSSIAKELSLTKETPGPEVFRP